MTTMVSQAGADRCYIGIPKWFWSGGIMVALCALVAGVAGWVMVELNHARDTAVDVAVLKAETAATRSDIQDIRSDMKRLLEHFQK